ncbi:unnamed protein product [Ceratitis capitata]|uniref:(Mediterranean fruit fly) hypothetical protein n=1 Tax=Ceratitis capitata TaxID=7213 RepID=A0A811UEK2_CERCA|nr:unnamed protein product [Ceratitis capitata]
MASSGGNSKNRNVMLVAKAASYGGLVLVRIPDKESNGRWTIAWELLYRVEAPVENLPFFIKID